MAALEKYGTRCCINCGYLGKRDGDLRISECYGVSEYDREFGTLDTYIDPRPKTITQIVPPIKTFPWCFVGKANLRDEVAELFDDNDEELKKDNVCIHRVIAKKRNCPSWYPWREFSSPREQWEESMMLAREKRREEFEQRMEKDRKDFELKLFEMNKKLAKDSHRVMVLLTVALIIFAIAQVAVAFLN